ncbi:histidine kinase [Aeromicrobium sp. A1-2]|uniref:PP2C family protein-serine/threonine phosphatase n=1 Tax=Aeromicrobium sp. A1-2 TaxID=2107713 RepID=UPI000E47EE9B|nr:SpoIIE family protein phosphatase [Aeromicrobium sp. A1-2]AXT84922.1 histidine kinase [Aeromicrobium sp. A1-2]
MTTPESGFSSVTDAQRMYDMAPCGYVTVAWSGTILAVNRTFLQWTGYTAESLVGVRTFVDLLSRATAVYSETHLRPMLLMGSSVREIALELVCADGSRLAVLLNASLERADNGEPEVMRVVVFDASERRAYERELFRAKERAEASEAHARLLARTLQDTLIPPSPPQVPGLEIAAAYRPAGDGEEVGGDFYEVFQRRAGEWVVVLGDVCGKGVDAAVVTALVRYSLRAAVVERESPAAAMDLLNRIVLDHDTDRFCTIVLMYLRQSDRGWVADVCTAGHPAPVLVQPGQAPHAEQAISSLVGVLDDPVFVDAHLELAPGDLLLLYTDGVTEGRRDTDFFGEERMHASIETHRVSAAAVVAGLLADVLDFQRGRTTDDLALVALKVPEGV